MTRKQKGPGPGAYNIPFGFGSTTTTKAYSMRGKCDSARGRGGLDLTPGPAEYEPQANLALKASAQYGFGTAKRSPLGSTSAPGPGEYTPFNPNVCSSKVRFGRSKRPQVDGKNQTPGPGAYNPLRVKDTMTLATTMGGGRDESLLASSHATPGPAAYYGDVPTKPAGTCGFGTAARVTISASANSSLLNPGPGSYETKPSLSGPKISMTPRREAFDF